MKLHILGNPNVPSSPDKREDYFSYDVYKFIRYMSKYFKMIHYGLPGSRVDCKHIDLPAGNTPFWNIEANQLIRQNKSAGDIILCFYGADNHIATAGITDCKVIEAHIGYKTDQVFAPYRIFTSYAQMHYYYGQKGMLMNPSWWDAVIPNAISVDEFDLKIEKMDYVVFLGRVQNNKGINVAIQATQRAKKKLIIAGEPKGLSQCGYKTIPNHVVCIGRVDVEQRKELLANAMCLIAPTEYIEPFGNIVVEAHLSGTPTITTDWGGFIDTNIHGVTGYRCRMMGEFVDAIGKIGRINPETCRMMAEERFSDEVVYEQMRQYILRVARGDWYQETALFTQNRGTRIEERECIDVSLEGRSYPLTPEQCHKVPEVFGKNSAIRSGDKVSFIEEEYKHWEDELDAKIKKEAGEKLFEEYLGMFSVIIPTMGVLDPIPWILELSKCPLVGEILIIDNSDGKLPTLTNAFLKKIKVIYSGSNIYVNPAWNLGVKEAKFENIILANDDLLLDDINGLLSFIAENLKDGMVIGLNPAQDGPYSLSGGHYIGRGWGRFIAIKKGSYKPIPEELKVWYGDNLLSLINTPCNISGVKGVIGGSASCNLPAIQPIIQNDNAIYPKLSEKYLRGKKICHIIMSCGRPEYLDETLQSLDRLDFGCHKVFRILVDDYPKDRDNEWFVKMADAYHVDNLILNEENKGLSKVWSDLWDMIKDMDFDYILHQEDDVILNEEISVDDWIDVLDDPKLTNVCSAVLTRQKWYFNEQDPEPLDTDNIYPNKMYRVEYRNNVFSPMMSLYRHSLTREGIREKYGFNLNEGVIMQHLREKGQVCAFIKNAEGKNLITHIGDWFHGKRVLPGEPNYERFSQYDPDKFYCSKSGRPKE